VLAQVRQEAQLFRERVHAGESAAAFFLHGGKVAEFCARGKRGTRPGELGRKARRHIRASEAIERRELPEAGIRI
jgi:hypothetical protein